MVRESINLVVKDIVAVEGNLKSRSRAGTESGDVFEKNRTDNDFEALEPYFSTLCYDAEDILSCWERLKQNEENGVVTCGENTYFNPNYRDNEKQDSIRYILKHSTRKYRVMVGKNRDLIPKPINEWTLQDFGMFFVNRASKMAVDNIKTANILDVEAVNKKFCFIVASDDSKLEHFMEQLEHRLKSERRAQSTNTVSLFLWHRSFAVKPKVMREISTTNFSSMLLAYENFLTCFQLRWILVSNLVRAKILESKFCFFELYAISNKQCYYTRFFNIQPSIHEYLSGFFDDYEFYRPHLKAESIIDRLENISFHKLKDDSFAPKNKFKEYFIAKGGFSLFFIQVKNLYLHMIVIDHIIKHLKDLVGEFNNPKRRFTKGTLLKSIMVLGYFLRHLGYHKGSYKLFKIVKPKILKDAFSGKSDKDLFYHCLFLIRKARSSLACDELRETTNLIKGVKTMVSKFTSIERLQADVKLLVLALEADLKAKQAEQCFTNEEYEQSSEKLAEAIQYFQAVQTELNKRQNYVHKMSVTVRENKGSRRPSLFLVEDSLREDKLQENNTKIYAVHKLLSPTSKILPRRPNKVKTKQLKDKSMRITLKDLPSMENEINSIMIAMYEVCMRLGALNLSLENYPGAIGNYGDAKEGISLYKEKDVLLEAAAIVGIGDCYLKRKNYAVAFKKYRDAYRIYSEKLGKLNPKTIKICEKIVECTDNADHMIEGKLSDEAKENILSYEVLYNPSNC